MPTEKGLEKLRGLWPASPRMGRLVLAHEGRADTYSRACRFLGHAWETTTYRSGARITQVNRYCNRCGANQRYEEPDDA